MESVLRGPCGNGWPHFICMSASVRNALCKELLQIGCGPNLEFLSTSERLSLPVTIKHSYVVSWNNPDFGYNKVDALLDQGFPWQRTQISTGFINRDDSVTE